MNTCIEQYLNDQENPEANWLMAINYDSIGQTASALSFYLRTAERSENPKLQYESLIKGALCYLKQGARSFTVRGMLQQAVATLPDRPEAYYWLSVVAEQAPNWDGNWADAYLYSTLGTKTNHQLIIDDPLRTNVDYAGIEQMLIQQAHCAWWVGLCDQSREMFLSIYAMPTLSDDHRRIVYDNLVRLKAFQSSSFATYDNSKHDLLKVKFEGSELIKRNYSEAYQDMFVLTMLNGKRDGSYLEIGAGAPFYGSNTALLEQLGWSGMGLDLNDGFVQSHHVERKNVCLLRDATTIDYNRFLAANQFNTTIDYLQIDVDPADVSLTVLRSIPFDQYMFAVITFEHDRYADPTSNVQHQAQQLLETYGYQLVVNNISPDSYRPYEDWFVHPQLVDSDVIEKMKCVDNLTKMAEHYMIRGA